MERVILHCDLNCFFASVELLDHPELRERPVAVSGDPRSRHGIILAKNEPAKACGVKTAETVWQARSKCPELVLLPSHYREYQRWSREVNSIYGRYTDLIEPFGIDESWLDVSGTLHLFGKTGEELADDIRAVVRRETGLTLSVGVSFNKVFAKLGSDYKKPDATTVISRENFRSIVWPLSVSDLLFVGRASKKVLHAYGVDTIGQLAAFPRDSLLSIMGKAGGQLWDYANGLECSPVSPAGLYTPPKSVGRGTTFPRDLTSEDEVRQGLATLSDNVAFRLRRHCLKASTVQLSIRDPHFRDICRQKPVPATCVSREISEACLELLRDSWRPGSPIRALTVTAHNLVPEDDCVCQLDFFAPDNDARREKLEKLERTMDGIRTKYGRDAVYLASAAPGGDRDT